MTDERLQQLMTEAAPSYRVPQEPPLDAMWGRIEAEHFDAALVRRVLPIRWRRWSRAISGIAATLLVGFGLGRFTAPDAEPLPGVLVSGGTAAAPSTVAEPLQRTTSRYLDDAALLLASLNDNSAPMDARFATHAAQLLTMTRLLLDSQAAAADPNLRDLLEDLELVLAQVIRLNAPGRAEELTFITAALNERDMVERLRSVAAAMSYTDF